MTVEASVEALILELGWEPAGATWQEEVRMPTARAPIFGGIGGELRTFGGRARYHLPGTDRWVTVGPRTTNFYQRTDGTEMSGFEQFRTKDIEGIRAAANPEPSS